MIKKCSLAEDVLCDLWIDYQINLAALDESTELCHSNWIEICKLRERIDILESILSKEEIPIPPSDI